MKYIIIIFFLISCAQCDKITFAILWDGILLHETGKRHYKNGKVITGAAGEVGVCQLLQTTFDWRVRANKLTRYIKPSDISNKTFNLWAGRDYFRYLYFEKFPGQTIRAVSAYNAGPSNKNIMTNYIKKVKYEIFKKYQIKF